MAVTYYNKLFCTGQHTQRHFNVSSPSSHRNKCRHKKFKQIFKPALNFSTDLVFMQTLGTNWDHYLFFHHPILFCRVLFFIVTLYFSCVVVYATIDYRNVWKACLTKSFLYTFQAEIPLKSNNCCQRWHWRNTKKRIRYNPFSTYATFLTPWYTQKRLPRHFSILVEIYKFISFLNINIVPANNKFTFSMNS